MYGTVSRMSMVITPIKSEERSKLGIRPGDTVRVHQKVVERGKTRVQVFEGLVIAAKHGTEPGGTFTVRATVAGVGVEKIFPLYTPLIEKIEIVKRSKVRRAKLYFIREKAAKQVRRQLRNARMMNLSTTDFEEELVPESGEEEQEALSEENNTPEKPSSQKDQGTPETQEETEKEKEEIKKESETPSSQKEEDVSTAEQEKNAA